MNKIYHIAIEQSMAEDFTSAFVFASDIVEKILGKHVYPDAVSRVHKKLKDNLKEFNDAFELIVNDDMRYSLITHIKKTRITFTQQTQLNSIDEVIEKTVKVDPKELLARIFACFDNDKREISFYTGLSVDMIAASKYIDAMDLSAESKNLLLRTIIDTEGYSKKILDICYAAKRLVEEIYSENSQYIKTAFKAFEDEDRVRSALLQANLIAENEDLTIVPSFINYNIVHAQTCNNQCRVILSPDFENVIKNMMKMKMKVSIDSVGKLFSDETRCRIIDILKERECYLAQLSQELSIPSNTLHYHIQLLNDDGILISRNAGRRYYYRLNTEYFEAIKDLADKYIVEINENMGAENQK